MSLFGDSITAVLILGAVAVIGLLLTLIITPINVAFQGADIAPVGKQVVGDWDRQIPAVFDWLAVIVFIGMPLLAFGLAFATSTIPSYWFWIAVALIFVFTSFGFVVEDVWASVTSTQTLSDAASRLPFLNFILSNYNFYFLFVWLVIAGGTYIRFGGGF